ncbi:hypothetical protein KEM52_004784, partial [Ascosphaera acerosa]
VLFIGRTNVGKSSLLNLLLGEQVARESKRKQITRSLDAFSVGVLPSVTRGPLLADPGAVAAAGESGGDSPLLTIIDSPGYGTRAREDWGPLMEKFLTKRKR